MQAIRNLRYYWAANIPVLLGVMLGATVLTGALFVGDSLRGSLRARTDHQLNGVGSAFLGSRMIRQQTAERISESTPALLLTGSAAAGEDKRLGRTTILGLREEDRAKFDLPNGVVVSATVAERLGVKPGDTIELGLQRMSKVPRSSLLGQRDVASLTRATKFKIDAMLPAHHPMNDFNLTPSPLPPLNVYIPLKDLQKALELLEKAIQLDPAPWMHRDHALFLATYPDAKFRDGRKAVEAAKLAFEKKGKNADWEFFAALAAAYAETGDFDLAMAEQKKAIADEHIHPTDKKEMVARLELFRAKKPYRDE